MKYPSINKQPRREVNIPELNGGANFRDSISNILDNQLTDCLNVWWQDGALRTRPCFKTNENMKIQNSRLTSVERSIGFKVFPEITKDDAVLVSYTELEGDFMDYNKYKQYVFFWWQSASGMSLLPGVSTVAALDWAIKFFVVEKDGVLYCYFQNGEIHKLEYTRENATWKMLTDDDDDIYAPIVYHHCLVDASNGNFSGIQFESYNLSGNRYRVIYSTVSPNSFVNGVTEFKMKYPLPGTEGTKSFDGKVIIAKITYSDKVVEHKVVFQNGNNRAYEEKANIGDNLIMCATNYEIWFELIYDEGTENEYTVVKTQTAADYIEDNLEITISYETLPEEKGKVFGMTQSVWFGGSANGISDGSRLFLCGNTNENEQALVVWSGLNDPTYFPENNYAYVGNKAQAVKTFGKQDDKLVIFKPNETYYTYYVQNNNITADDLINQSVVDYQASSVYFPMIQLNGAIGCDMPDTLQLCRNRLVWAHSNGKVYTLVSTNQYSEMSIYETSQMVERKIREANYTMEQFATAQSCDFAGHYVLIIGQDAYVMDYNSYGYQYVYGHLKNEDANVKIPWYVWKLIGYTYVCFGENIATFGFLNGEDAQHRWLTATVLSSDNAGSSDEYLDITPYTLGNEETVYIETRPIKSSLTTKLFDFGAPHYRKNVDRVSISFGNNGGLPIAVRFFTDVGTEEETIYLSGGELAAYTPRYVTVKQFSPCIRSHTRFGVQIECEGLLAVDAVNLLYRLLGGVR